MQYNQLAILAGMNAQLVVSAADLREFGREIYEQGRMDAERAAAQAKQEQENAAYTREEAAEALRVSVSTIDNMRKRGMFGEQAKAGLDKAGGRVLIPRARIDALINH